MARLFVALLMPDPIKEELLKSQKALRRLKLIEGNYIRQESLHLTLKFIGHVEDLAIPAIIDALRRVKADPCTLRLERVGTFSDQRHIQVIWASVLSQSLYSLAATIEQALLHLCPSEERPFAAHITLVRVKKIHRQAHVLESLQHIALKPLSFTAHQFVLMESKLTHEGASYEVVATVEL